MAPSSKRSIAPNDFFLIKLAHGHFGLSTTFWHFGAAPLVIWMVLIAASYLRSEIFFTMVLTLSFLVYSPFVIIGLIQSAKAYRGKKLWSHLTMF